MTRLNRTAAAPALPTMPAASDLAPVASASPAPASPAPEAADDDFGVSAFLSARAQSAWDFVKTSAGDAADAAVAVGYAPLDVLERLPPGASAQVKLEGKTCGAAALGAAATATVTRDAEGPGYVVQLAGEAFEGTCGGSHGAVKLAAQVGADFELTTRHHVDTAKEALAYVGAGAVVGSATAFGGAPGLLVAATGGSALVATADEVEIKAAAKGELEAAIHERLGLGVVLEGKLEGEVAAAMAVDWSRREIRIDEKLTGGVEVLEGLNAGDAVAAIAADAKVTATYRHTFAIPEGFDAERFVTDPAAALTAMDLKAPRQSFELKVEAGAEQLAGAEGTLTFEGPPQTAAAMFASVMMPLAAVECMARPTAVRGEVQRIQRAELRFKNEIDGVDVGALLRRTTPRGAPVATDSTVAFLRALAGADVKLNAGHLIGRN